MKMKHLALAANSIAIVAAAVFWAGLAPARADEPVASAAVAPKAVDTNIVIETIEPPGDKQHHDVTWLGLAVTEAPAELTGSLGVKPGVGLVVLYVASGSAADKAELHKNDILTEFDGQILMDPIQLRKLVQMHAQGENIKVTYYRDGKKQIIHLKLGRTIINEASSMGDPFSPRNFQIVSATVDDLQDQVRYVNGQLYGVNGALARAGVDKTRMNAEIRRTMEQTRLAIADAVRHAAISEKSLADAGRELEALAHGGVYLGKDTTVIIRNKSTSNKTVVQTDDAGSYVVDVGEKTHLTARDNNGKLLFEGDIDTAAQREKVPKAIWEKVGPVLEQMNPAGSSKPKPEGRFIGGLQYFKEIAAS
ncbi:MAG TPA: PDZ domain-containing protein [Verrucomicrobiae bacterium]|jgi:hypothetical protein